jgi:hypothetical protein
MENQPDTCRRRMERLVRLLNFLKERVLLVSGRWLVAFNNMIRINNYPIDDRQIVFVPPCGAVILKDHGTVQVSKEAAKSLLELIPEYSRELPKETSYTNQKSPLPSHPSSSSKMTSAQRSTLPDQELRALWNQLLLHSGFLTHVVGVVMDVLNLNQRQSAPTSAKGGRMKSHGY